MAEILPYKPAQAVPTDTETLRYYLQAELDRIGMWVQEAQLLLNGLNGEAMVDSDLTGFPAYDPNTRSWLTVPSVVFDDLVVVRNQADMPDIMEYGKLYLFPNGLIQDQTPAAIAAGIYYVRDDTGGGDGQREWFRLDDTSTAINEPLFAILQINGDYAIPGTGAENQSTYTQQSALTDRTLTVPNNANVETTGYEFALQTFTEDMTVTFASGSTDDYTQTKGTTYRYSWNEQSWDRRRQ